MSESDEIIASLAARITVLEAERDALHKELTTPNLTGDDHVDDWIAHLQELREKYGNTCLVIERGGWGATGLWMRTHKQCAEEVAKLPTNLSRHILEKMAGVKPHDFSNQVLGYVKTLEAKCEERLEALKEARKHLVFDKQGAGSVEQAVIEMTIGRIDKAISLITNP